MPMNAALESAFKLELRRGDERFEIAVHNGDSILDQALAQGVPVAHGCHRGDCGDCKAEWVHGEVSALNPAQPLRKGAEVYLCNARALTASCYELPYARESAHLALMRSPTKIHSLQRRSDDVMEIALRLPPANRFDYLPGQYLRLTHPTGVSRSYSLASPPRTDKLLILHVRRVPGGTFSEYLFNTAAVGDLLQLEGPKGQFFLRDDVKVSSTVLLATGTGIAPIYAMLNGWSDEALRRCGQVFVYWGNRQRQDAYLADDLSALCARRDIRLRMLFSRETTDEMSALSARHVQDAMAQEHTTLTDAQVFAAGATAMVDEARVRCRALGLPDQRFYSDPFTAS